MCPTYSQRQDPPYSVWRPRPTDMRTELPPPPAQHRVCYTCAHVNRLSMEPAQPNYDDLFNADVISPPQSPPPPPHPADQHSPAVSIHYFVSQHSGSRSASIVSSVEGAEDGEEEENTTTYAKPPSECESGGEASTTTDSVLAPSRSPSPVRRVMPVPPLSRSPTPFDNDFEDVFEDGNAASTMTASERSERTEALSPIQTVTELSVHSFRSPPSPYTPRIVTVSNPVSVSSHTLPKASTASSPLTSKTEFDSDFLHEKNASSPSSAARHPLYSFSSGLTYFMVESTLFTVHRHFFERDSRWLQEKWAKTHPFVAEIGSKDIFPVVLDGIKCVDFERFLSLYYPLPENIGDEAILTTWTEWASVAKVASKLQCDDLLYRAINKIDNMAPSVDRILIGREHAHRDMVLGAFCQLINRHDALRLEEIKRLPVEDVAVITARRERRLRDAVPGCVSPPVARADQVEACCWGRLPPSSTGK